MPPGRKIKTRQAVEYSKCPVCHAGIQHPIAQYCTQCGYRFDHVVSAGGAPRPRHHLKGEHNTDYRGSEPADVKPVDTD